jgi:hypothetical protein
MSDLFVVLLTLLLAYPACVEFMHISTILSRGSPDRRLGGSACLLCRGRCVCTSDLPAYITKGCLAPAAPSLVSGGLHRGRQQ